LPGDGLNAPAAVSLNGLIYVIADGDGQIRVST
jgi:hypothetical protein